MNIDSVVAALCAGIRAQDEATALWHVHEPPTDPEPSADAPVDAASLRGLILSQHLRNFRLWHVEDEARRRDVDDTVIADCKRRIDRLNQERNDRMEQVDVLLLNLLAPLLPPDPAPAVNTESPGMAVDRLSILSLKIWHMDEQTRRDDADAAHRERCRNKLDVLRLQRADLEQAVADLLREFAAGTKRPKPYFQFKMYNDPSLNPRLYGAGKP